MVYSTAKQLIYLAPLTPEALAVDQSMTGPIPVQGSSEQERQCLKDYSAVLSKALGSTDEIVDPLRCLVHIDVSLADEVWSRGLKAAWVTFTDTRRADFAAVARSLLSKPWHSKALNFPPLMQGSHNVRLFLLFRGVGWGGVGGSRSDVICVDFVSVLMSLRFSMIHEYINFVLYFLVLGRVRRR